MDGKNKKFKGYLLSFTLLASLLVFGLASVPTAQAHIVIIGSPSSDLPADYLTDAKEIATALKAKGYTGDKLVELYGQQATSTNILKAMYNADAVIYVGHGGYQSGHYNGNGGTSTPPYSLVGYASNSDTSGNEFIWGTGNNLDKMMQGWNGQQFTAPLKSNSMAFLFHACFSTGDVEGKQVANSAQTILDFSKMFTGAGASYYASAYFGGDIISEFLNGATSFYDANSKLNFGSEKLNTTSISISGNNIWRSNDKNVAFTGNWSYKFPSASQISDYNPVAAAAWYAGDKTKLLVSAFTAAQNYMPTEVTFKEYSCDVLDTIVKWTWNFGDGSAPVEFDINNATQNVIYNYGSFGNYNVTHTVTNSKNQTSTALKTVNVQNRAPVVGFTVLPSHPAARAQTTFNSTSYDPDHNDSIVSTTWNFGDGSTATGQSVNHAFSKDGYYKIYLTVKDNYGKSSTTYKTITVGNPKPDLIVSAIAKSGTNIYVKVKNQGPVSARGFTVRLWYGKSSGYNYKNIYVSSLSAGSSKVIKFTKYKYSHGNVKVDYYNKVSESSESNNVKSF